MIFNFCHLNLHNFKTNKMPAAFGTYAALLI